MIGKTVTKVNKIKYSVQRMADNLIYIFGDVDLASAQRLKYMLLTL